MAIKNVPLTIHIPGQRQTTVATAVSAAADDSMRIPRRYPFVDISNYDALKTAGFFRHATTDVSAELGGSAVADTEGVLGYQLPRTEKMILVAVKGADTDEVITIEGSVEYGIDDEVVTISGLTGDVVEIDLYDLGLMLAGSSGEAGAMIKNATTTLKMGLLVRAEG